MRHVVAIHAGLLVLLGTSATAAQQASLNLQVADPIQVGSAVNANASTMSSTSYILVTGTLTDDTPFTQECPRSCKTPAGTKTVAARLIYNPDREELVGCNEQEDLSSGICESTWNLVAKTRVRAGELKLIPAQAEGYQPWTSLQRTSASRTGGVRLVFAESADDSWNSVPFAWEGINSTTPSFQTVPAGSYVVHATDLSKPCLATQTNPGVPVTVPAGGQAEVTIYYATPDCNDEDWVPPAPTDAGSDPTSDAGQSVDAGAGGNQGDGDDDEGGDGDANPDNTGSGAMPSAMADAGGLPLPGSADDAGKKGGSSDGCSVSPGRSRRAPLLALGWVTIVGLATRGWRRRQHKRANPGQA